MVIRWNTYAHRSQRRTRRCGRVFLSRMNLSTLSQQSEEERTYLTARPLLTAVPPLDFQTAAARRMKKLSLGNPRLCATAVYKFLAMPFSFAFPHGRKERA
ncbi:unnamed protein product [Amoebophrya sp. A25]|nr:unnamed protein product [Amoebophrya sp. A25]|eukprot:GSA25T00017729001.1